MAARSACAIIAVCLLVPAALRSSQRGLAQAPPIALADVTLIDGTGAPARPHVTIVIRNGKIDAVQDASVPVAANATVENLAGRFVVPGLIDAHVHITGGRSTFDQYATLMDNLLAHGITGIRDMAGDARILGYLAREAALGERVWPNVYYTALMAGPTFFAEDQRVPGAAQGLPLGTAPWMHAVDATTDIKQVVAEGKGTGATALKLYANLPASLVAALTAEAHRQGLRVWAHATVFPAKPSEVVAAGADAISHSAYLVWEGVTPVPDDYGVRARGPFTTVHPDDPRIVSLLDAMKARGTVLDATLRVFVLGVAGDPNAVGEGLLPWSYAVTKEAHDRGVTIDAGTDSNGLPAPPRGAAAASSPTANDAPVVDELALLVEHCGFTPLEAIHAATAVNASVVGQAATRGTIEPGKAADLVVLSADPLTDVRNLAKIEAVFKDGKSRR